MRPETRVALDELDPALRRLEGIIEHSHQQIEKMEQVLADAKDLRRRLLNNDRRMTYRERQAAESKALLAQVRGEA